MSGAGWATYAAAITEVHREREQITRERSAAGADRVAALGRLADQLTAQREGLEALGKRLRAAVTPAELTPAEPTPAEPTPADPTPAGLTPGGATSSQLGWDARTAALAGWLSSSDRAADEARQIGGRPQLLPGWTSTIARHAVVYALVVLPNALFTIDLSLSGVTGSDPLLWWFGLIFPLLAAIGGGILVGRLCAPRICPDPPDGAARPQPPDGAARPQPPAALRRRHRWLAVPFAWASWLVPGFTLDLIAPQLHR